MVIYQGCYWGCGVYKSVSRMCLSSVLCLNRLTVPSLSPFSIGKNKDALSGTWTAHYSAGSENMPCLCHWTPQRAIADLRTLAVQIVSTCPSLIPRCSMSSLVIVWSRQSFISSASGSVGLGQIWAWTGLSGSLETDYHLNVRPFLPQKQWSCMPITDIYQKYLGKFR